MCYTNAYSKSDNAVESSDFNGRSFKCISMSSIGSDSPGQVFLFHVNISCKALHVRGSLNAKEPLI